MKPSPEQSSQLDRLWKAYKAKDRIITLAGGPGTGKSTSTRFLVERLVDDGARVGLIAPTWVAAGVLKDKVGQHFDLPTSSGHGFLYGPPTEEKEEQSDDVGRAPRTRLNFNQVNPYTHDAIILDEAGMANRDFVDDLLNASRNRATIIGIGDDGQLPPVEGKAAFDLAWPTGRLTEIQRQALGSPIPPLAQEIRQKRIHNRQAIIRAAIQHDCPNAHGTWDQIARIIARHYSSPHTGYLGDKCEVAIVTTNRSRLRVNTAVRQHLGFPHFRSGAPAPGERVMLTMTNRSLGLGNGEVGNVVRVSPGPAISGLRTHEVVVDWGGRTTLGYSLDVTWNSHGDGTDPRDVGKPARAHLKRIRDAGERDGPRYANAEEGTAAYVSRRLTPLTPAYAVTVWRMQGSEAPGVLVALENCDWMKQDAWKVRYTAITRAREEALIVELRG